MHLSSVSKLPACFRLPVKFQIGVWFSKEILQVKPNLDTECILQFKIKANSQTHISCLTLLSSFLASISKFTTLLSLISSALIWSEYKYTNICCLYIL